MPFATLITGPRSGKVYTGAAAVKLATLRIGLRSVKADPRAVAAILSTLRVGWRSVKTELRVVAVNPLVSLVADVKTLMGEVGRPPADAPLLVVVIYMKEPLGSEKGEELVMTSAGDVLNVGMV